MKIKLFFLSLIFYLFTCDVGASSFKNFHKINKIAKIQKRIEFITGKNELLSFTENFDKYWKYKFKNIDGKVVWLVLGHKKESNFFYMTKTKSLEIIKEISDNEEQSNKWEIYSKIPTLNGLSFLVAL